MATEVPPAAEVSTTPAPDPVQPLARVAHRVTEQLNHLGRTVQAEWTVARDAAVVRLDPPDLGQILVRLNSGPNGLRAEFTVDTPHVRQLIESSAAQLVRSLADDGVTVSSISVALSGGASNAAGRERQSESWSTRPPDRRPDAPTTTAARLASPIEVVTVRPMGRLDVRA